MGFRSERLFTLLYDVLQQLMALKTVCYKYWCSAAVRYFSDIKRCLSTIYGQISSNIPPLLISFRFDPRDLLIRFPLSGESGETTDAAPA